MPFLRFLRNIAGYTLVATLLISPIGWILLCILALIKRSKYCLDTWIILDKLVCHLCHRTGLNRTLSGYTGQYMYKIKRYRIQAKFIDFIFGKNHCSEEFKKERSKGYVK